MQTKICTKCGIEKKISEFYKDKRGRLGVVSICKECYKKYCKKWREENKEARKKWFKEHKEEIKEYKKKWFEENKEEQKEYKKKWHKKHKEEHNTRSKKYQQEHKEEIKEYRKNQYKTNKNFRFSCLLRNSIKRFFKGYKSDRTEKLLGCSYEFAVKWIETQFTPEMSWDNIHIDHIRPLASFNNIEQDKFKACNWRNLQPLLENDNLEKYDSWDGTNENLTYSRQAITPERKREMIKEFEIYLQKQIGGLNVDK